MHEAHVFTARLQENIARIDRTGRKVRVCRYFVRSILTLVIARASADTDRTTRRSTAYREYRPQYRPRGTRCFAGLSYMNNSRGRCGRCFAGLR